MIPVEGDLLRVGGVAVAALGVLFIGAGSVQAAERKCGFGMWELGEPCRQGPLICERIRMHGYLAGTKQWKCWHRKGVRGARTKRPRCSDFIRSKDFNPMQSALGAKPHRTRSTTFPCVECQPKKAPKTKNPTVPLGKRWGVILR